jgi:putative FmdB family regulatory protein
VPTYGYQCDRCGPFDLVRPMAQASEPATCPQCGEPGRRVWDAPGLSAVDPALRRALDADARRADTPDVVGSPPPRSGRVRYTTDPRHQRLPRP